MDIYRIFFLSSILTIFSLFFNNTYAAVFPITGVDAAQVNPANIQRALSEKAPKPLSSDKKIVLPSLTQDLDLGEAKKYKLTLRKVRFSGNTVISTEELMESYRPYIGKVISLAKLLDLISESTRKYHEQGYILSQAYLPAQDIDKKTGSVEIAIVEGYVNSVTVVSDTIPYSTKILLQQYGERLKAERPITKSTLERYALLSNDLYGTSVKVVFAPALNKPGAADVELIAEDSKLFGTDLFTNNRGTRLLGPDEYSASFYQYNGLYGNKTTFNAVRTDADEMRYYMFNHRQPLNSDGLSLIFNASRTETHPDFLALSQLNRTALQIPGESDQMFLQLEYPLIRSRLYNFLLQAKVEGSDNITKFAGNTLFKERLRMLRVGFIFDWLDSLFFGVLGTSLVGVEFTQGIDGLDAYLDTDFSTRPNVKKDFQKVTAIVSRTQPLVPNLYLLLLGTGQYAFNELVSSEEFGYGGRVIGLGYDAFQLAGDHGISGKAELLYNIPTEGFIENLKESLEVEHGGILDTLINFESEIFGFYDGGRIRNIDHKTSAQKKQDNAVSAGFGVRGRIFQYLSFSGYFAQPQTREAENELDKKPRYFYSVGFTTS